MIAQFRWNMVVDFVCDTCLLWFISVGISLKITAQQVYMYKYKYICYIFNIEILWTKFLQVCFRNTAQNIKGHDYYQCSCHDSIRYITFSGFF